ncbi:deoxyribonuclease Tat-D [Cyclospora cayetanensis]|uniref:Deoxyribonuclease Tat-D n=1 Tax=Cyclospora cayetanensis TaxID=88456 RepID=A0A6P6S4Y7_9EIME|nr:deoxyribonuclease Tat-D [Cyclospora cayetanensis]
MASRFVDIGANLCDPMYEGKYHDKQKHPPDIHLVLRRAEAAGVDKIILTSGAFEDLRTNLKIAELYDPECERLFMTAGIHPTRCTEFAAPSSTTSGIESEFFDSFAAKVEEAGLRLSEYPEVYVQRLFEVHQELQRDQQRQRKRRIVAVGEIGLDYDRLHFCDAPTQKHSHCLPTAASACLALLDFVGLVSCLRFSRLNGCSLKTQENLAVVQQLPLSRILLETDAPWCGLRHTHAGFSRLNEEQASKPAVARSLLNGVKPEKWEAESQVKGRNEPCNIRAVAAIVRQLVAPELSEEDFCSRLPERAAFCNASKSHHSLPGTSAEGSLLASCGCMCLMSSAASATTKGGANKAWGQHSWVVRRLNRSLGGEFGSRSRILAWNSCSKYALPPGCTYAPKLRPYFAS